MSNQNQQSKMQAIRESISQKEREKFLVLMSEMIDNAIIKVNGEDANACTAIDFDNGWLEIEIDINQPSSWD